MAAQKRVVTFTGKELREILKERLEAVDVQIVGVDTDEHYTEIVPGDDFSLEVEVYDA